MSGADVRGVCEWARPKPRPRLQPRPRPQPSWASGCIAYLLASCKRGQAQQRNAEQRDGEERLRREGRRERDGRMGRAGRMARVMYFQTNHECASVIVAQSVKSVIRPTGMDQKDGGWAHGVRKEYCGKKQAAPPKPSQEQGRQGKEKVRWRRKGPGPGEMQVHAQVERSRGRTCTRAAL